VSAYSFLDVIVPVWIEPWDQVLCFLLILSVLQLLKRLIWVPSRVNQNEVHRYSLLLEDLEVEEARLLVIEPVEEQLNRCHRIE
jgi:hypothetical protein